MLQSAAKYFRLTSIGQSKAHFDWLILTIKYNFWLDIHSPLPFCFLWNSSLSCKNFSNATKIETLMNLAKNIVKFFVRKFLTLLKESWQPAIKWSLEGQKRPRRPVKTHFFSRKLLQRFARSSYWVPGGEVGGASAYERGGDTCRKFWIQPIKETDPGVAQAFFDP